VRSKCTNFDVTTGCLNADCGLYAEPDSVSGIYFPILWLKGWGDTSHFFPSVLTIPQTKLLRDVRKFLGSGVVGGSQKIYSILEIPTDIEDLGKKVIKNYPIK
jgi:hypothetical protein